LQTQHVTTALQINTYLLGYHRRSAHQWKESLVFPQFGSTCSLSNKPANNPHFLQLTVLETLNYDALKSFGDTSQSGVYDITWAL